MHIPQFQCLQAVNTSLSRNKPSTHEHTHCFSNHQALWTSVECHYPPLYQLHQPNFHNLQRIQHNRLCISEELHQLMETVAYVSKSSQYSASLSIHYGGYGHKLTTTGEKMHNFVKSRWHLRTHQKKKHSWDSLIGLSNRNHKLNLYSTIPINFSRVKKISHSHNNPPLIASSDRDTNVATSIRHQIHCLTGFIAILKSKSNQQGHIVNPHRTDGGVSPMCTTVDSLATFWDNEPISVVSEALCHATTGGRSKDLKNCRADHNENEEAQHYRAYRIRASLLRAALWHGSPLEHVLLELGALPVSQPP